MVNLYPSYTIKAGFTKRYWYEELTLAGDDTLNHND